MHQVILVFFFLFIGNPLANISFSSDRSFFWVTKQNLRHLAVKKWTDDFSHLSVQLQHVLCRAHRSAPQATAWLNLTAFEFAAPVTLSPVCPLLVTQTPAALLQPSCFQGSFIPPATPPSPAFCLWTSKIPLPNWSSCALYSHRLGVRGQRVHLETQNAPDSFTRLWVAFLVVYIFRWF